jgi:hypothetical protein
VVAALPAGYRAPAVEPFLALLKAEADAHRGDTIDRTRFDPVGSRVAAATPA